MNLKLAKSKRANIPFYQDFRYAYDIENSSLVNW